jgi:hypothetical protein
MPEGVPKLKTVATVALAAMLPVIWAWRQGQAGDAVHWVSMG